MARFDKSCQRCLRVFVRSLDSAGQTPGSYTALRSQAKNENEIMDNKPRLIG